MKKDHGLSLEIDFQEPECRCGSNKPYQDCCGTPKLKTHIINMHASNYHRSDSLAFSIEGEIMRIKNGGIKPLIGSTNLTIIKQRENRRGKLLGAFPGWRSPTLNPDLHLLNYQDILVVDTNSMTEGKTSYCSTGIFHLVPGIRTKEGATFKYAAALRVDFINPEYHPEKVGWLFAIETIKTSPSLSGRRIAIATDHDHQNHNLFNGRQIKICEKIKIPKNIKLLYAAADRGDHILNKLMRKADMIASEGIRQMQEPPSWTADERFPCSALRVMPNPPSRNLEICDTKSIKYLGPSTPPTDADQSEK